MRASGEENRYRRKRSSNQVIDHTRSQQDVENLMANQFDAKIRFYPSAWRAWVNDGSDGIEALLEVDDPVRREKTARWRVRVWKGDRLLLNESGESKDPQAARSKARRMFQNFKKGRI